MVCQSDVMVTDMADLGVPRHMLRRIYNPVAVERISALTANPTDGRGSPASGPRLVSVGRLARQKGYDLLLEAMVRIPGAAPGARHCLSSARGQSGRR